VNGRGAERLRSLYWSGFAPHLSAVRRLAEYPLFPSAPCVFGQKDRSSAHWRRAPFVHSSGFGGGGGRRIVRRLREGANHLVRERVSSRLPSSPAVVSRLAIASTRLGSNATHVRARRPAQLGLVRDTQRRPRRSRPRTSAAVKVSSRGRAGLVRASRSGLDKLSPAPALRRARSRSRKPSTKQIGLRTASPHGLRRRSARTHPTTPSRARRPTRPRRRPRRHAGMLLRGRGGRALTGG
jgi:hypothetical protein